MTLNLLPWNRSSNVSVRRGDDPFNSLQNQINQLFDNMFNDFQTPSLFSGNQSMLPAVDIKETDEAFNLEAELPGMNQDDVEVTVNDNYLTIKGEKKESKEEKQENYVRRERYFGSYQRTIALPETADADKVKANFDKGVLSVEIPKKAEAKANSRKIKIEKSKAA